MGFIKRICKKLSAIRIGLPDSAYDVMIIRYDLQNNHVECLNFIGQKIRSLSGNVTDELWQKIVSWSRLKDNNIGMWTQISIWDNNKGLAYCEPIDAYVENPKLLKTGNGYGNNYNEIKRKEKYLQEHHQCPACKSWVKNQTA